MNKEEFLRLARLYPVAAAVKDPALSEKALHSEVRFLFLLRGNALEFQDLIHAAHQCGKAIVVHLDLVGGIGKDRAGIHYLREIGVDAIITSRSPLVAAGRAEGLVTIQRLLLLEDSALEKGARTIANAKPDLVEILPGVILPEVASALRKLLPAPFIAGGFIRTFEDVQRVQQAGAILSSSSTEALWVSPMN